MDNSLCVSAEVQKTLTTKELAEQLKTTRDVILANARKCLPEKKIEHGKTVLWNEAEITILLDHMKTSTSNNRSVEFNSTVANTTTELTPALKIKKAFDLMQEGYEEELALLKAKNLEQQKVLDRIQDGTGCFTMNQTAKALKLPYGNIKLFERLRKEGLLNKDNSPTQKQLEAGHFKVVVKYVNETVGSKSVTLTTSKGLVYLAKRFNAEIDHTIKADA